MKIDTAKIPFPCLIANDVYNNDEIDLIDYEYNFLMKKNKINKNQSLVLDEIYNNKNFSDILSVNRKIYDAGFVNIFSEIDPQCKLINQTNFDVTKLISLNKGERYDYQVESAFNFVSFTFFSSGTLLFPEYNYSIDLQNNSLIIFPSHVVYGIDEIKDIRGKFMCQLFTVIFENE